MEGGPLELRTPSKALLAVPYHTLVSSDDWQRVTGQQGLQKQGIIPSTDETGADVIAFLVPSSSCNTRDVPS